MDLERYDTRLMELAIEALARAAREDLSALHDAATFALIVRDCVVAEYEDDDDDGGDDDDEDEDEGPDDDGGGLSQPLPEYVVDLDALMRQELPVA
jgi:hypothetical protein